MAQGGLFLSFISAISVRMLSLVYSPRMTLSLSFEKNTKPKKPPKPTFSFFEVWHPLILEDLVRVKDFEAYQEIFSKYCSDIFEIIFSI